MQGKVCRNGRLVDFVSVCSCSAVLSCCRWLLASDITLGAALSSCYMDGDNEHASSGKAMPMLAVKYCTVQ